MDIVVGKKYKTRNGLKARVICTDANNYSNKTIIALVSDLFTKGSEAIVYYCNDGSCYSNAGNSQYDLIEEWKEEIVIERWVNVYAHNRIAFHLSEKEALANKSDNAIATIKISGSYLAVG